MGNCIKPSARQGQQEEEDLEKYYHQEKELEAGFGKKSDDIDEKGSLKLKIMLTKEKLEWLMFQLKVNKGKKLEDVLQEIERERERRKVKSWKPSLESILETLKDLRWKYYESSFFAALMF